MNLDMALHALQVGTKRTKFESVFVSIDYQNAFLFLAVKTSVIGK